jgi:hypothetical protein
VGANLINFVLRAAWWSGQRFGGGRAVLRAWLVAALGRPGGV